MSHAFAWRPAVLASLVLVPAMFGAGSAMAQTANPDPEVRSITLHYGDLDLSTAKGRNRIDARIRQAAGEVCGQDPDVHALSQDAAFRDCYNRALSSAHRTLAQKQTENQMVRR